MVFAPLAPHPERALRAALAGEVDGIAAATSGSSGASRQILIRTGALTASAAATEARLGGPGRWLLALPPDRIGGAMVLVRSAIAKTTPVRMTGRPFTAKAFAAATRDLERSTPPGVRLYASLVPTQWRRVAEDPRALAASGAYAAILVGGSALGQVDRGPARLVETYGATETCGGCVYDGLPLEGVVVDLDPDRRVLVGGSTLATAYSDGDDSSFSGAGARRLWRSADLGEWRGGRLAIVGRADNAITTGGLTVHPEAVEAVLSGLSAILECVVVGVPDAEWGESIVAIVVPASRGSALDVETVRSATGDLLPRYALPRAVVVVDNLPRTEGGKIDREAARVLARG